MNHSKPEAQQELEKEAVGLPVDIEQDLYQAISVDAFDVLGLDRRPLLKWLVTPVFQLVLKRFSAILAEFEHSTEHRGFRNAVKEQLPRFINSVETSGEDQIPSSGPLLLASNHPAAYDAFLLAAALPRDDLKIMATDIQLVDHMPRTGDHFIFIGPASRPDSFLRMTAVRQAVRHLRDGGSLLVFPSGLVDPDPSISVGAKEALEKWNQSLELFIRRVPDLALVLAIVSGVLSKRWLNSPVTRLRREPHNRQKVAEVFQVIDQLFLPGRLKLDPKISFSRFEGVEKSRPQDSGSLMPSLISQAMVLLEEHKRLYYLVSSD